MTFTDFCARLENVKFSKGGTYCRAVVPGSGSKDRNLAAWEKDGWIWFTDHTKKRSKEEILGVLGLEIPDLKTVENGATKYVYKDEKNKPLFKKIWISRTHSCLSYEQSHVH